MTEFPSYKQLRYWVESYGRSENPDNSAVHVFMDCETQEAVVSLRGELIAITNGNFRPETMDALLGQKRRVLHESYETWAKRMLQWMAAHKG